MTEMFLHAIACSMCCITIYAATRQGNILFPIVRFLNRYATSPILEFIKTPIYGCLTCMCSFWGILYYLTTFGLPQLAFTDLSNIVKFVLMVGATNFVADITFGYIEFVQTMNKHQNEHGSDIF